MKWVKSSPRLIETFDRILPQVPGVDRRKMFGYPCGFVNGTWFMGCYQENDIVLRLSEEDRKEFLKLDQARQFEPMPGRAMREFVVVPPWLMDDPARLEEWISRSLEYAASLPPPVKKPRKKKP